MIGIPAMFSQYVAKSEWLKLMVHHAWKSSKVLGKGTSQMRNGGRTQYEMCMDERGNKSDDSIASNKRH